MGSLGSLTNGDIMIIGVIAFLAMMIFPNLIRRKRIQKTIFEKQKKGEEIRPEDFKGKQKLFFTHNAQSSEIEEFLVKLKTFAFKYNMKIVFPGNFRYQGEVSPTTLILVGPFGLLLIRCYGFGGHIYTEDDGKRWLQNMNETVKEITDPIRSMKEEKALMHRALENTEFKDTVVYTASVFTRQNIILSVPDGCRVFDRNGLIDWLESDGDFEKDNHVPVRKLTDWLVGLVKARK